MQATDTTGNSIRRIAPACVPERLKLEDKWLCWRGVWDQAKQKLNKVPKTVFGTAGSSTNPETWATFEDAVGAVGSRGLDGIGFAGLGKTPYSGIDIDHCIDPETGEIFPVAMKIVREFDSYTEITPSLDGLRIWIEAEKPPGSWCGSKDARRELEVYDRGRFFTVTGLHLGGTPKTIERRQEVLDSFMKREAPPQRPKPIKAAYNGPSGAEHRIELEDRLQDFGVTILRQINDATSERAYYIVCPWVHEHTGGDDSGTRVGQYPSGGLWFHCDHGHCDGRKWEHFREHFEPGCYEPWWVKVVTKNG
jgi:hypothetical protein